MPILETAAIISSLGRAFSKGVDLYRDWKQRKEERKARAENEQLEQRLSCSGTDVESRYNQDFQRLGDPFRRGDEISRSALMEQVIILQETVISLLTSTPDSNPILNVLHPHHYEIDSTTSSVRNNSMSALGELFQRLSQAAPIRAPLDSVSRFSREARPALRPRKELFIAPAPSKGPAPEPSGPRYRSSCPGPIYLLGNSIGRENDWSDYRCRSCQWDGMAMKLTDHWGAPTAPYKSWEGKDIDTCGLLTRAHKRNFSSGYWWSAVVCPACSWASTGSHNSLTSHMDLARHIKNSHSWERIMG